MLTIKLPYKASKEDKEIILSYQKNQGNLVKYVFNRLQEDETLSFKQLYNFSLLRNIKEEVFVFETLLL